MLFAVLFLIFLALLWYLVRRSQKPLPTSQGSRCLLLIAHPDDETMFFGPTIRQLTAAGIQIFVFCVSTGNAEGLGQRRKAELSAAIIKLGLSADNLTILDHHDYQDGAPKWETEKLARIALNHIEKLDCDIVVTFDGRGVSSHSNHIACFRALQYLYTNGALPADVQVFVLETVSLIRKYVSLLDLIPSSFKSTFLYVNTPRDVGVIYSAMCHHRSQLVWYRFLYLAFSRYVVINSLKRIPIHRYMAAKIN